MADADLASILRDYVPRHEYDQLLDAFNEVDEEHTRAKRELGAYRGKERFGKAADKLGIRADLKDDVFDLLRLDADSDLDDKAMEARLKKWIAAKPSRSSYLEADAGGMSEGSGDDQGDGDEGSPFEPKPIESAGPRLRPADSGDAGRGRGGDRAGGQFRYRSADLSDHDWMQSHGKAYAQAVREGRAVKVG